MRKVIKQSGGLSLTELNVRFTWPYGEGKYSREIRDFKPNLSQNPSFMKGTCAQPFMARIAGW